MKLKYAIGDILFNLAADSHLLIEDIDYQYRVVPVSYRLMDLGTGKSVWWPIRLIDENRNYIKVA